jgi:hypothetical protein
MNSINFCYWLQGAFELSDDFDPSSKLAKQVIESHLKMVFANKGEDDKSAPSYHFCCFLRGVIESEGKTDGVKSKLQSVFQHIDQQYPNAQELVVIHDNRPSSLTTENGIRDIRFMC